MEKCTCKETISSLHRERDELLKWKRGLESAVIVTEGGPDDWDDPQKMINYLIDWHVAVNLDPATSFAAEELIEHGKKLQRHADGIAKIWSEPIRIVQNEFP